MESFCVEKGVKKFMCDVIGFDNNYFMIYLKKRPKNFTRNSKNSTSIKKDKLDALKFSNTLSFGGTLSSFHPSSLKNTMENISAKTAVGICTRLYTMSSGYDNYLCLGCCENK